MIQKLYCPVCGAEITAGQQVCLNCHVYLWEVV
jgi:predicted nucleic acid-binding Zn ribbon protein